MSTASLHMSRGETNGELLLVASQNPQSDLKPRSMDFVEVELSSAGFFNESPNDGGLAINVTLSKEEQKDLVKLLLL